MIINKKNNDNFRYTLLCQSKISLNVWKCSNILDKALHFRELNVMTFKSSHDYPTLLTRSYFGSQ